MVLTPQQLQTLRTAIDSDPAFASVPRNSDGAVAVAAAFNLPASPAKIVWKTSVTVAQVGQAFSSTELAGLTTANTNRLTVMQAYSGGTFNPSIADVRAGFDSVFSGAGGVNTRAALLALYKRPATRFEMLYATGTGSDASPATIVVEGPITSGHVEQAFNL